MQTLTREEAIKRIRDIRQGKQISHLNGVIRPNGKLVVGATRELMAIFDIKESEL